MLKNVKFVTYHDTSYADLENGGSKGAHKIFLVDDNGNAAPTSWQSKSIRRMVKCTLAVETLQKWRQQKHVISCQTYFLKF